MQLRIAITEFKIEGREFAGAVIPRDRTRESKTHRKSEQPKIIINSRNLVEKVFALVSLVIHD